MHGPRTAAIEDAPARRISAATSSMMPATSPRQPQWAIPITPSGLAIPTRAQSAANIASRKVGSAATMPSAVTTPLAPAMFAATLALAPTLALSPRRPLAATMPLGRRA